MLHSAVLCCLPRALWCVQVLCQTDDWVTDALRMKALMKQLDPLGQRVVSANQNGWVGPHTPLDLQGFDYQTESYDKWHRQVHGLLIWTQRIHGNVSLV